MEMSSGALAQGETMLCIPTDSLRPKKRQRLLVTDSTGESHNNARITSATTCLASCSSRDIHGSLESSVDSSVATDPPQVSEDSTTGCQNGTWDFTTILSVSCDTSHFSSDVISTIDYDEQGQLVATGGLARKIRICSYNQLIRAVNSSSTNLKNLFTTICMPAKLSSLKWKPGGSELIACGDYDGSVTEWDVEHGATVSERYEHAGRTVWSVDYSSNFGGLLASASSDSTVRLWSRNSDRSIGMINAPRGNSMCSVQFAGGTSSFYVAAACADSTAYVYDVRRLETAVVELRGHQRSVSYARWLGETSVVTSSPDGTVRLWDISNPVHQLRCFDRHSNTRNFVGLSVVKCPNGEGLIATGSENNEVLVYGCRKQRPVFRHRFGLPDDDKAFVGSVCWTRQEDHYALISANSEGSVQVIQASQK